MSRTIFIAAATLFVASCAANQVSKEQADATFEARKGEQVDRICFAGSIDGFGETTRNTIVVSEGRDHYLVETYHGCFGLDHAQSVAFDSPTSCLRRGDDVIPFDSFTGRNTTGPSSTPCKIKAIFAWDEDAEPAAKTDAAAPEADTSADAEN